MKILFIHQNFPAQFVHLATGLFNRKHDVRSLSITGNGVPNITNIHYSVKSFNTPNIDPLVLEFETKIIRAKACAEKLIRIKNSGFLPDIVIAHPGWGESMFVKDIFPKCILVNYVEFYYDSNADAFFDKEFSNSDINSLMSLRVKNTNNLLALESMDYGLCPTKWQYSTIPPPYQSKVKIIFDGINTDIVKPNSNSTLTLKFTNFPQIELDSRDEVVTFVNRNLEPYRGYHSFMRALPKVMRERPNAKILIVGGNQNGYGKAPPADKTWQEIFLDEVRYEVDLNRIFFLNNIPYDSFLKLLQISSAHVYLTYPFVMSWSCIEAMSAGALVIGSKTCPVEEFISHEKNGLLVDFFDYDEISSTIVSVLKDPNKYQNLRMKARETIVNNYDLQSICLPEQIKFIESLNFI